MKLTKTNAHNIIGETISFKGETTVNYEIKSYNRKNDMYSLGNEKTKTVLHRASLNNYLNKPIGRDHFFAVLDNK